MPLSHEPHTDAERQKLDDEWARANAWGRKVAMKKAVATIASTAVFGAILLGGLLFGVRGLVAAVVLGIPAGMGVRRALWPRGQFS